MVATVISEFKFIFTPDFCLEILPWVYECNYSETCFKDHAPSYKDHLHAGMAMILQVASPTVSMS